MRVADCVLNLTSKLAPLFNYHHCTCDSIWRLGRLTRYLASQHIGPFVGAKPWPSTHPLTFKTEKNEEKKRTNEEKNEEKE